MTIRFLTSFLALSILTTSAIGQDLFNQPESAVYDAVRSRYLVSNYTAGKIIAVEVNGTQSVFVQSKSPSAGLTIVGDTLYVGCGPSGVMGYHLETADVVMDLMIPGAVLLNDVEADTSGNLYVSDPFDNKIYRIDLSSHTYSTLVDPIVYPNGLYFNRETNRLLACCSLSKWIYSIDTHDGSMLPLVNVGKGHLDGLAMDRHGHLYVSAQGPDVVFRYDKLMLFPPQVFSKGHVAPADIFYNIDDDVLVVPNILGNTVDWIDVGEPDLLLVAQPSTEIVGNQNGRTNPGETVELFVRTFNYGRDCVDLVGELRSTDSYVTVVNGTADFGAMVPFGEAGMSQTPFAIEIDPACPDPHYACLEVDFYTETVFVTTDTCYLLIGDTKGFVEDAESGSHGWLHRTITLPYLDQWHVNNFRPHSGNASWKVGGDGGEIYANLVDCTLLSPPVRLPPNATLKLWHWIDLEEANSFAAFDGAIVGIISDYNPNWTQLTPMSGYSHRIIDIESTPLVPNTYCFSGNSDWSQVEFDLSPFTGIVQFVFRFGSDAAEGGEGWYIDDIVVEGEQCCTGRVGDANLSGSDEPTIGDVSSMIEMLFLSGVPVACLGEADVNLSGGIYPERNDITIGDVSTLIDYLFIAGPVVGQLYDCP